jgi:hypothetical protein
MGVGNPRAAPSGAICLALTLLLLAPIHRSAELEQACP